MSYQEQQREHNQTNGITEGVIWKQILIFFFPILIGTFFQQLYNTVDSVIVGQFAGKEALSSVGGSSGQIINLVVGFFTGLSAGATVIISQYFGAKDEKRLQEALHTSYAFSIIGGIIMGIIGVIITPAILRVMNTPKELLADSTMYVQVYLGGLVFVFVYNMGASILRAIGDAKRPLYYLIIGCILNILLDMLFVIVFQMGVLGVAIATLIAQGISAILVTWALMKHTESLKLNIKEICIHKETLSKLLEIGFPSGIQNSMYSFSNMLVQSSLNILGVNTMAAWTAFSKIDGLFWMICGAFGIAVTTFVGQNYGARKWERIQKGTRTCLAMILVCAFAFSAFVMMNGSLLYSIFSSDASVISIGMRMIQVITPTYFLYTFIEIYSGALRAQGYVLVTTIITLTGICMTRIIWITVIVPKGSLEQIIFCYPLTWAITAVIMGVYYLFKQRMILKERA